MEAKALVGLGLLVVSLAAACVGAPTSRRFTGPDGSAHWYLIECGERAGCLQLAGDACADGYVTDRDSGRSMTIRCSEPQPATTAPAYVEVESKGIRFELPAKWTKRKGLWFSPDEEMAATADSVEASMDAESAAAAAMENVDEQWDGTVHGHHTVFVTGTMRGSAAGLRVTRAVTVTNGRAYALTCAHRGTKAVSKVCMRILNSMQIDD